jgi:hypothetical protein
LTKSGDRKLISLHFLIEFSPEIDGGWPQCLQFFDHIHFDPNAGTKENGGGYAPLFKIASRIRKLAFSNRWTKDRDSDVRCCFTQVHHRKPRLQRQPVWPSGRPANKSAAFPRKFEAGSNVIDVSERQSEKQDAPMTVTEAGR